jgi:hypothetical protein
MTFESRACGMTAIAGKTGGWEAGPGRRFTA